MPKKPTDYSKLVIYKIQHIDNPELLYVGSTTDFTKRKYQHKSNCNNTNDKSYNFKLYKTIRENGGWDAFNMVVIKPFACENKRQAGCEEDRCIREIKANMNERRAFITPEEQVEYNKQYRLENREKQKQYYLENRDKILDIRKQYKLIHKEQIAEQQKQKITCECGCIVSNSNLAGHKRSKKHQDLLNKHLV